MLTKEEKNKIDEEEKFRAGLRDKYNKPPKKKTSLTTWIVAGIIGIIMISAIINTLKSVNSPSPIEPRKLNARISTDNLTLNIYNDEKEKWTSCKVYLNVDYKIVIDVDPGKNSFLYSNILKNNSVRFNYYTTKPTRFYMKCQNPLGEYSAEW